MIRSEKTRQLIIEKTSEVFNKQGYVGTSLSDLTAATGLTKGSIYGNFKDKQEVAIEAFRYNYKLMADGFIKRMNGKQTAIDKLLVFVHFYRDEFHEVFQRGGCVLLNTATDADDIKSPLFAEVKRAFQDWLTGIEAIIRAGMDAGEIKNVNAARIARKMVAMIEGSVALSKTLEDPAVLIDNMDSLKNEILGLKLA